MRFLIHFVLFSGLFQLEAQQVVINDTSAASSVYASGDSLLALAKYDDAILLYKSAFQFYNANEIIKKELACLNKITGCYARLGNLDAARNVIPDPEKYFSILGSNLETSDMYNLKGIIAFLEGNYTSSLEYNMKAVSIRREVFGDNHVKVAFSMNNIGAIYSRMSKYDSAANIFNEVASIYIDNGLGNSLRIANTYLNLGNIYQATGFNDKALDYYNKTLQIRRAEYNDDHPELAVVLNNLGNVFMESGEVDKAIEYHERALISFTGAYGSNHRDVAMVHNNLGNDNKAKKNYEVAINHFKKSIAINNEVLGRDHEELSNQYLNLGLTYMSNEDYQDSRAYLHKSLSQRLRILGNNNLKVAESMLAFGELMLERDSISKSLIYIDGVIDILENQTIKTSLLPKAYLLKAKCLKAEKLESQALKEVQKSLVSNLSNTIEDSEVTKDLEVEFCIDKLLLLESMTFKASLLSNNESEQINRQALEVYKECKEIINSIRHSILKYEDKLSFAVIAKATYERALLTALELYQSTNEPSFNEEALFFSEASRQSNLKDALQDISARNLTNIPDSLIKEELAIKSRISYYRGKRVDVTGLDSINNASYSKKLFALNRSLETLKDNIESSSPDYYGLKYIDNEITLREVQSELSNKETIIHTTDMDSLLIIFTITNNSFTSRKIRMDFDLKVLNEKMLESLIDEKHDKFTSISNHLYNSIYRPLEVKTEKVIIIPDGNIWFLNFDILTTKFAEDTPFNYLPYLIHEADISYAYTLNSIVDKNVAKDFNQVLAFSYAGLDFSNSGSILDFSKMRNEKSEIPGTSQEVLSIARVGQGKYFFGEEASEKNFKKEVDGYGILHLAVHGVLNDDEPMNSYFQFRSSGDSLEDDQLHSFEIYSLNLNANLAVLSACNTGAGNITSGEGIMSMAKAFSFAGCKNLIVSGWELSDQTTPAIMSMFYKGLLKGERPSESLRNSKLEYLKSADEISANPYYWASLTHIGNNEPLETSHWFRWYYLLGLLLALTLFLKRKKSN